MTFVLSAQTGPASINTTNHTVNIQITNVTSLINLTPSIIVSDAATISPVSGAATDFTNPVQYTVTSEDGTVQVWNVTVTVAP